MFVHHGKLDQLLSPSAYVSNESFEAERSELFRRNWHIVGLAESLQPAGAYIACEVLGVPVVVHRGDHGPVAFRNACAHRHAMLVPNGM